MKSGSERTVPPKLQAVLDTFAAFPDPADRTNLLGYPNVRNYDGSWTEWGNSVGVPIEK